MPPKHRSVGGGIKPRKCTTIELLQAIDELLNTCLQLCKAIGKTAQQLSQTVTRSRPKYQLKSSFVLNWINILFTVQHIMYTIFVRGTLASSYRHNYKYATCVRICLVSRRIHGWWRVEMTWTSVQCYQDFCTSISLSLLSFSSLYYFPPIVYWLKWTHHIDECFVSKIYICS